jgi:hypothetical protein
MNRVNSATQRQGWGGARQQQQQEQQETLPSAVVTSGDAAVDVTPPRDNVRRTFSSSAAAAKTGVSTGQLRQVPSFEDAQTPPPSLVNLSLVSSSEDASRSSVETGPIQKQQQHQPQFATPTRNTTKKEGDNGEDHPLSPRYLSYRSSLASRLSSTPTSPQSASTSVYVSTFSPKNDLEVITSSPIGNRTRQQPAIPSDADRERRIAAAMLVSDDDDDDESNDGINNDNSMKGPDVLPESVRDRLNKRLWRYQAGAAAGGATAVGGVGEVGGRESSASHPHDEDIEREAAATGAGAAAALTAAFASSSEPSTSTASSPIREFTVHNNLNDNNRNINSMTPKSVYSTTSSLTDPNLSTFSVLGPATPDRPRWNDTTLLDVEESIDPILSIGTKPATTGFSADAYPDDEGSLLGVTRSLHDFGGDGDKSPTCLSPRSSASAQPARRGRSYMWLLLGGGTLLLLTAVALALAFLLTNRANSSSQASSAAEDNGNGTTDVNRTAPEEGDPDWSALYPSLYPARAPSSSNATTDDVFAGGGGPTPTATPTLRRPTAKPTDAPSLSPTYSAEDQELLDLVTTTYVNQIGMDPATVKRWVEDKDTSQQRALQWLMASHDAADRQELGSERMIQRYALATFFYATNGTVLDRVGDDDLYYEYLAGSWLNDDDECRWLPGVCRQGRVTNIKLKGVGLMGTIPPELALLSGLEEINLSENNLRGTLPTELGVLSTSLRRLNLRENRLTGTFPVEYESFENVEIIRFDSNLLTGTVPQQVCQSYFSNFNATQAHPHLYLDCGGSNPEIACPPGICCTYCCIERNCDCVFANTALEYDLC